MNRRSFLSFLSVAPVALLAGCSDPQGAARALDNIGMTDIRTDGYALFACGEGDQFATKFTAKNPNGKTVSGAVCSGVFKGATVRFD